MNRNATTRPRTVAVLGGSIAGMLSAAAIQPHVDRVVVIEHDALPHSPSVRPGTPQAGHAHGLLAAGRNAMEALLPGLTAELVAAGAISKGDIGSNGRWWIGGGLLADSEVGHNGIAVSRPLLESAIRERVRALPGVELRDRTDVDGLVADDGSPRVTGVALRPRRTGSGPAASEVLHCDLVVDASGRAGRAAGWFSAHGWEPPAEEQVKVEVRYATTHVQARPDDLAGRSLTISAATPALPRGGAAIRQEDGTWVVMAYGYAGEQPPLDPDGFRAYLAGLVSPDLSALLADREPLEPLRAFRFPACRRRRFERLGDVPDGYVAIGDAICSFDPTFGQGMTVAALQAVALRGQITEGLHHIGTRFHKRAAAIADMAWDVVVGADLQIPGVIGSTPLGHALISRYVRRVQQVAHHDPVTAAALIKVTNLLTPPASLMHPRIAIRLIRPTSAAPHRVTRRPIAAL